MWWELSKFSEDIERLEVLLFEIAAHDDELKSFGLRYVLRIADTEEARVALEEFSSKLENSIRVAPFIDKSISERLNSLLSETKIEDLITQLAVRLKIAERERPSYVARGLAVYSLFLRRLLFKSEPASLFTDKTISIESVLASLSRLRTLVKTLEQVHYQRSADDDEIFKPSNIDINIVAIQIDSAIENLNLSDTIGASEKERLIEYLNEAKAELAENTPAWKKVVGALIICATLLSGAAAAPAAIDNLNTAIKHILGTSVEKAMPNLLPGLPAPQKDGGDEPTTSIA